MKKLYYNGPILTMEETDLTDPAEAVLTEDGKIVQVGSLERLKEAAGGKAELCDLDGRTLMPAFIDPHSHFIAGATGMLQVSLDGAGDFAEIIRRVRSFIRENQIPEGQWVLARDYDHNDLAEKRHPNRHVLDEAAPDHPLILQHKSGHVGTMNTMALQMLGVTKDTKAPEGGRIEMDADGPLGYMEENAFVEYLKRVPMPGPAEIEKAFIKNQEKYASYGITTAQEGMFVKELIPLYQYLLRRDVLKLDLNAYVDVSAMDAVREAFPGTDRQYAGHFRIGGYKIFLDGSPQGRTAWMREPYQGEKEYRGYGTMETPAVEDALRLAAAGNWQILAHCNGDAAAEQYLNALEKVESEEKKLKDLRPVLVHGQLLHPDQLGRVRDLGIIPTFFVAHVYHWGDIHIENFGRERASRISPAGSAMREGIRFTFHQDAPVIQPDMMETVWCAVCRRTKAGVLLGEAERIPVREALKAVTINGAYQYFEENEKGSIRSGKRADLILLSDNPAACREEDLRKIRVEETVKDGETIYKR
jgi:predicted amidohydrolase YtcJ